MLDTDFVYDNPDCYAYGERIETSPRHARCRATPGADGAKSRQGVVWGAASTMDQQPFPVIADGPGFLAEFGPQMVGDQGDPQTAIRPGKCNHGDMDEYPLLPIVEEIAAQYRPRLETEGWTVEIKPNVPGAISIELEHSLVPGRHGFGVNSPQSTAEEARESITRWFESNYQFEVVRGAPVRPKRRPLLRKLRAAALFELSEAACIAITSAGYALYEEGVLRRKEADWLGWALERDLEEAVKSGRRR